MRTLCKRGIQRQLTSLLPGLRFASASTAASGVQDELAWLGDKHGYAQRSTIDWLARGRRGLESNKHDAESLLLVQELLYRDEPVMMLDVTCDLRDLLASACALAGKRFVCVESVQDASDIQYMSAKLRQDMPPVLVLQDASDRSLDLLHAAKSAATYTNCSVVVHTYNEKVLKSALQQQFIAPADVFLPHRGFKMLTQSFVEASLASVNVCEELKHKLRLMFQQSNSAFFVWRLCNYINSRTYSSSCLEAKSKQGKKILKVAEQQAACVVAAFDCAAELQRHLASHHQTS
jgi:hypothetical protein